MPLIWMEFRKGRSIEQKRAFARSVTDAAVRDLGTRPQDVRLRFIELEEYEVANAGVLVSDRPPSDTQHRPPPEALGHVDQDRNTGEQTSGARAFAALTGKPRPGKPRDRGETMMIDWGIPLTTQQDLLDIQAQFIDQAKIAVGISGMISEKHLRAKINSYSNAGVKPFPGGMFAELAYHKGMLDQYFEECWRVGYELVEISDNVVHLDPDERQSIIQRAIDHGFSVLGEVGSKHTTTEIETLADDIRAARDAGAFKVLVEAAELVRGDGAFDPELVDGLVGEIEPDGLIFELPGVWIPGYHQHQGYQLMVWLVQRLGPTVNIGNVLPELVIPLETLRTGLGVTMKLD